VDDVGRCINPLIVDGQTHGAIVQGIGQAMWEQCYIDPDSGQPMIGSLMDLRPAARRRDPDLPHRDRRGALAHQPRSASRPAARAARPRPPAVIVSAIVDALRDYGIGNIKMPATPYNIWKTIQDAKAQMEPKKE